VHTDKFYAPSYTHTRKACADTLARRANADCGCAHPSGGWRKLRETTLSRPLPSLFAHVCARVKFSVKLKVVLILSIYKSMTKGSSKSTKRGDLGKTSLGQMANAPLALVLAQVRFSPYLTLSNYIPAIQDALRKNYPAFRHDQTQSVEIGPTPGPPKTSTDDLWNFTNRENQEGFVIQQHSLVFLATHYKTFDDFSERHVTLLRAFEKIVPDVLVERLGLRYVDVIVPKEGEKPEDYVTSGLRGCEIGFLSPKNSRSQYQARWILDDGTLLFRFATGITPPFWPSDLRTVQLTHPEVITRAHAAHATNLRMGIMDFDRIANHRGPFVSSDLSSLFSKLHDDLSRTFKGAMSSHAEAEWNSKR